MSDVAIKVENLGKLYKIGAQQEHYKTLRESLVGAVTRPFNRLRNLRSAVHNPQSAIRNPQSNYIWALKDVSFEVKQGEVIGIIGRNGAGKSTLLKILSHITEPTEGRVTLRGRVGSLLEVGTGFHPELTGRENIYLNGAILGMKKAEIERKFDEIVAFTEIEKFIDTPVKRYSSGMYVRLAFAVAAHLEPEILVVDEVLAVGDAQFQKKCLGKMGEVAKEGRSVLFVSHNMGAISVLTQRVVLLGSGRLLVDSITSTVISKYLSSIYDSKSEWRSDVDTEHPIQIRSVILFNDTNQKATEFDVGKGLTVQVEYVVREPIRNAVMAINLHASDGAHILSLEDIDRSPDLLLQRSPGLFRSCVKIPGNWLNSGTYLLRVGSGIPRFAVFDNIDSLQFSLIETGETTIRGHRSGYLLPMLSWTTESLGKAEIES